MNDQRTSGDFRAVPVPENAWQQIAAGITIRSLRSCIERKPRHASVYIEAARVLRGLWTVAHNKVPPAGTMTMLANDVAALAALIDRQT